MLPFIEREAPAWRAGTARLFVAGENVGVRAEPETTAPARHPRLARAGPGGGGRADASRRRRIGVPGLDARGRSRAPRWCGSAPTETRPVSGLYYAFARVGGAWKLTRIYSLSE